MKKLAVVVQLKTTGDTAATVAHFFPNLSGPAAVARRKLVWGWGRDEEKLRDACKTLKGGARKKERPLGVTATLPPDAEEEIIVWINELRGNDVPISTTMLAEHAKIVTTASNITVAFQASWWWQKRFLARHRLSIRARTRQGQTTPPELDNIAAKFADLVKKKMTELGVSTVYNADQTDWWNAHLSVQFLQHHFGGRADRTEPVLLLWDDFSGHWTREVIECAEILNVELFKVPFSATLVSQPADVAWNKPLKQMLRKCWVDDLKSQLAARVKGKPFKLTPPSRKVICGWVAMAWQSLSSETISGGFRRAKITQCDTHVDKEFISELVSLDLVEVSVDSDDDFESAD